ncbi:hypothetical protein NGRA_2948 [Nosema granulosis]|uniref:Uncharacterized protein n=1 Tax=Nosema granulosis TaxID=83296 RepID=A0A9P6GW65_9MICR|nr:hypothetical protein NGRA_2948 [Nosema granulosis]
MKNKIFYNFSSLSTLKEIIKNEKKFRVQIVSFEPLDLFLKFLDQNKYTYKLFNKTASNSINILQDSEPTDAKKVILYSNKRDTDYVQIIFNLTREEKQNIIENQIPKDTNISLLLDTYPYKNTEELINLATGYSLNIPEIMKNSVDYLESVILLCMIRNNKLLDIISNVRQVDSKLDNVFMIRNKILGLVEKKVVVANRDTYKINISHESLKAILERIDFDVNRT